jgi:hypothetical protein
MVSKDINGYVERGLADGQGKVLVFVEAVVLRLLTESAITQSNHGVHKTTPVASMVVPREERLEWYGVRLE